MTGDLSSLGPPTLFQHCAETGNKKTPLFGALIFKFWGPMFSGFLLLNPTKTKFLLLGTPQLLSVFSECITLNFLGKRLHPFFTPKDLGVVLDSHLKYDPILVNWFHHV